MDPDHLTCLICGQLGQGKHFGVFSCRACAAFFRRSVNSKLSQATCHSKLCNGKSYHCKPCRLKRCYAAGMDISKFQHNSDGGQLVPSNRKRKIPDSIEVLLGKPNFGFFEKPSEKKPFVDLTPLILKAMDILRMGSATPLFAKNYLQKLNLAETCSKKDANIKKFMLITKKEVFGFWEHNLLASAKWLVHFDKFQELEEDVKLQILSAVWHIWGRLDRLMGTSLYQMRNREANRLDRLAGNGIVTHMEEVLTDARWMSSYPVEKLRYFLDGVRICDLFSLIDEIQSMDITETELSFMLAQLCFQYASSRFEGEIKKIMEEFIEIISDDLHDYYTTEKGMSRYSGRLTKLLKINKEILENVRVYRGRAEVARVFNVFNLEFSHPQMFQDTGYST